MTRRFLTLCLALTVWDACSPLILAAPAKASTTRPTAALDVSGYVSVDGEPSVSGQTIFSGSEVETGHGSRALVGFGSFGQAEVAAQSALRLEFDEARLGVSLNSGGVRLRVPSGLAAAVRAGGCVVTSDGTEPVSFTLKMEGGRINVLAHAGRLTAHDGGEQVRIDAGEEYTSGQEKPGEDKGLSGKKKLALILSIAGVAMLAGIIFTAKAADDAPEDFGEEVIAPS
jgi:hypothetical protein